MVIRDLDVVSIACFPAKADAPLIVDPDAPLALAITAEFLESIPRRDAEIFERDGGIELPQLAQRNALQVSTEPPSRSAVEELLRLLASEASDHRAIITLSVTRGKILDGLRARRAYSLWPP